MFNHLITKMVIMTGTPKLYCIPRKKLKLFFLFGLKFSILGILGVRKFGKYFIV